MENFYRLFFYMYFFYVRVLSKENGVTFLENCQKILYKKKKWPKDFLKNQGRKKNIYVFVIRKISSNNKK